MARVLICRDGREDSVVGNVALARAIAATGEAVCIVFAGDALAALHTGTFEWSANFLTRDSAIASICLWMWRMQRQPASPSLPRQRAQRKLPRASQRRTTFRSSARASSDARRRATNADTPGSEIEGFCRRAPIPAS